MGNLTGPWFDTMEALPADKPESATPYPLTALTPSKAPSVLHTEAAMDIAGKGNFLVVVSAQSVGDRAR